MTEDRIRPVLFLSSLTADSGSGIRFWNMARAVADAGQPVVFLERKPAGFPARRHPGVEYRSSPEGRRLTLSLARSLLAGMRLVLVRRFRAVYALKPMPNAVLPALVARARGARIALDVDDLDFAYYRPGPGRGIVRGFFRAFPRCFHAVSCHVTPLREFLEGPGGVPPARIHRIPQGVDLDVFRRPHPPLPPAIAGFLAGRKTIVYMASLGITSDFEDVLPLLGGILGRHPDWGLLVLGHGVRLEFYRREAARLGLDPRVLFAGYVPHEMVPAILAAGQAGFHYLRPEGANRYRAIMKIREYLAAGLPVVANSSGDAADFREYISIAADQAGFESALAEILAGAGRDRAERGRRFIERELDWPRLAPQILAVLTLSARSSG